MLGGEASDIPLMIHPAVHRNGHNAYVPLRVLHTVPCDRHSATLAHPEGFALRRNLSTLQPVAPERKGATDTLQSKRQSRARETATGRGMRG